MVSTVFAIGDSHMQALGPRLRRALQDDRPAGHYFGFDARPGASTSAFLQALPVVPPDMDLLIVELGGNDRGTQSTARAALAEALRAQAPRARILWVGPSRADTSPYLEHHEAQADAQAAQSAWSIDRWMDSRPVTDGNWRDGVHFTPAGYDRWAAAIVGEVRRMERRHWRPWLVVAAIGAGAWWLLRR